MVHFPGLLQLRLFNRLCLDFEIVRGLVSKLSLELSCGLLWLCRVECFVDISMPQPRLKISISTDTSVLEFYGYIGYIGDISVNIFA